MYILILVIGILMLLKIIARPYEGPMVLIFANLRTGKTTLLAKIAQREIKIQKRKKSKYALVRWLYRKKPIYDNIVSNTPLVNVKYVPNIRELIQYGNAPERTLFLVDEGYLVWPNRKIKGMTPITDDEAEYMKLIGHYDSKMIIVSQSYEDIDIIVRRIYTSMFLLNKLGSWTTIKPIKKIIDIDEETRQIIDAYKFRNIFTRGMFYRPRYYKLFDTKWKPKGKVHPDFTQYEVVTLEKMEKVNERNNNLHKKDKKRARPAPIRADLIKKMKVFAQKIVKKNGHEIFTHKK